MWCFPAIKKKIAYKRVFGFFFSSISTKQKCNTDQFPLGFHAELIWGVTATPFSAMERILFRIGHHDLAAGWRATSSYRPTVNLEGAEGNSARRMSEWAHRVKNLNESTIPQLKAVMIRHTKDMVIAGARALELPDMPCSALILDMTPAEEKAYHSAALGKDFGYAGWKRILGDKNSAAASAVDLQLAHVRKATCVKTKLNALGKDLKQLLRRDPSAHVVIFTRFLGSIDLIEQFMSAPVNGLTHVEFMSISSKAKVTERHKAIRDFQKTPAQPAQPAQPAGSSSIRLDSDSDSDSDSELDEHGAVLPATPSARDVLLNYYTHGPERGLGLKILETTDPITKLTQITLGNPTVVGPAAEGMGAAESAARSSLHPGDVLVGIDGTLLSSVPQLQRIIAAKLASLPKLRKIPMVLNIQSNAVASAVRAKGAKRKSKASSKVSTKASSKVSSEAKTKSNTNPPITQPGQAPKCLVVSYRTGQCGITLTAASCVYLLEPPILLRDRVQAGGRIHRLGQEKTVALKVLAMKNTIDEVICTFHGDLEANKVKMCQGGRIPEKVVEQMVHVNHPDPSKAERRLVP